MIARRSFLASLLLAGIPVAGCTSQQSQQLADVQTRFAAESGVEQVMLATQLQAGIIPVWIGYIALAASTARSRRDALIRLFFQYAKDAGLSESEMSSVSFSVLDQEEINFLRWPTADVIELCEAAASTDKNSNATLNRDGRISLSVPVIVGFNAVIATVTRKLQSTPKGVTEIEYFSAKAEDEAAVGTVAFQRLPATPGHLASMQVVDSWLGRQQPGLFTEFRLRYGIDRSSIAVRSNTEQRPAVTDLGTHLQGSDPRVSVRAYTAEQWPYLEL